MAAKKAKENKLNSTTVAKQDDGTVQINFVLPWNEIFDTREKTIEELAAGVEVPGFRKGKAPLDKAREKLDGQFVIEKTLSQLLPKLFADAVKTEKLRPAMYPKFELIHAHENEDWQVRATTAELPEFELGDYKKVLENASKSESIWTPEKGDPKEAPKELNREQKENVAINALSDNYKFTIPKVLTDEEVNSRLSSLLERIEKLGLSLESYLASIKKSVEDLRKEYAEAAERAIRLDIVLGAIAEAEKVQITEEEINQFVNVANASSPQSTISEEQKSTITSFLLKRKVLDKLASYV